MSQQQWLLLNELILRIHSAQTEHQLIQVMTEDFPQILGQGTFVCWNEHQEEDMQLTRLVTTNTHSKDLLTYTESLNECMTSHPLCQEFDLLNGGKPGIGVFSTRAMAREEKWDERAIYQEVYQHMEMKDQLVAIFCLSGSHLCNLSVNADNRFSQTDKLLVSQLLPHLTVAHQRLSLPPQLRQVIENLSPRQKQITHLINKGRSRKEIANDLSLSIHTVNDYCALVYDKFHVHSQPELMILLKTWNP